MDGYINKEQFIEECNYVIDMYLLFKYDVGVSTIINKIRNIRDNTNDITELNKYKDTFNNLYSVKHFKVNDVFNISMLDVDKVFILHQDELNKLYNNALPLIDEYKNNKYVDQESNKDKLEEIKKDISIYRDKYNAFNKEVSLSNKIKENQRRFSFLNSLLQNIDKNKELYLAIYHSGDIY